MEDFLYAYNQPKKFGKYDLILDGKIIANEVVTKSGSIGGGEDTSNCVKINEPITITKGDNTTSITSDTISTTTLSGTLDAESMKNSLTAEAIQNVAPIAWSGTGKATTDGTGDSYAMGVGAKANGSYAVILGCNSQANEYSTAIGGRNAIGKANRTVTIGSFFVDTAGSYSCTTEGTGSITIGAGANTLNRTTTVDGVETTVESSNSITIGCKASNSGADSVVIGAQTRNVSPSVVIIGAGGVAASTCGTSIGAKAISSYRCFAAGYDSVTNAVNSVAIGAGAKSYATNTVLIGASSTIPSASPTDAENTTVIGYGATASAPNAVVLGAGCSTAGNRSVVIGANQNVTYASTVCIGYNVTTKNTLGVAIGHDCTVDFGSVAIGKHTSADSLSVALGLNAQSTANRATAIGASAVANDGGVVVFSSWDDAESTKTQLYFSGANTSLANQYYGDENGENGEAFMGYTVTDANNNVRACGTRRLSELFPDNSLTQPATINENGEWVMPKVFHPSDLDLPIEEPSENNDVEINIPTIETPIEEEYKPLPIYPIVEPQIEEIID